MEQSPSFHLLLSNNTSNSTNKTFIYVSGEIALCSLGATIQVFLELAIGFILAHPKLKLLHSHKTRRKLAIIVVYVFLPCFMLSDIASSFSWNLVSKFWFAVLGGFAVKLGEIALSHLIFVFKKDPIKRISLVLSTAFNNSAALPFIFLRGIAKIGLFKDPNAVENGKALLALYYVPANVIFYSYGLLMLKYAQEQNAKYMEKKIGKRLTARFVENINDDEQELSDDIEENSGGFINPSKRMCGPDGKQQVESKMHRFSRKAWYVAKNFFNFPMIVLIISLVIGLVVPFRSVFLNEDFPVLGAVFSMTTFFGKSYLPCAIVLVGAILGTTFFDKTTKKEDDDETVFSRRGDDDEKLIDDERTGLVFKKDQLVMQNNPSKMKKFFIDCNDFMKKIFRYNGPVSVVLNVFTKLVLFPFLVTLILFIINFFWIHVDKDKEDFKNLIPIIFLIMLIESSTPVKLTLNVFACLFKIGENEFSELLLWQYIFFPFTMMVWNFLFLLLIRVIYKNELNIL